MRARSYWLGLLLLQGCQSSTTDQASPPPPPSGAMSAVSASATATPSVSASAKSTGGKAAMPPEARRNSAPEGIANTALGVGKKAPALKDIAATTGAWSKSDKTTVLVFYRGFW